MKSNAHLNHASDTHAWPDSMKITHGKLRGCLAYIKYEGKDIRGGYFGTQDAINALLGFDKILRYYVDKEIPEFKGVSYDFPVKIQKGSWEILLPSNVDQLMTVIKAGGSAVLAFWYLKSLAETAAKDGLFQSGPIKDIREVLRCAIRAFQLIIAFVKHMKGHESAQSIRIENDMESVTVYNKDGVPLTFPSKYLDIILKCPRSLLSNIVMPIRGERSLKVGVCSTDGKVTEEIIDNNDKGLFSEDLEGLDELPELIDGEPVVLNGRIVRANEKEQSFGFQYNGHVITCKPAKGLTIATFKQGIISARSSKLYQTEVKVEGLVERVTVDGRYKTRPRLFVHTVLPIDNECQEIEQAEFDI